MGRYPYFSEGFAGGDEITWDFRRFYVGYVSNYFVKYDKAREYNDYVAMLDFIDGAHSLIWGRIKTKWDEKDETFLELREKVVKLSNEYKNVFLYKRKNPQGTYELRRAFNRIIEYLVFLLNTHQLFGKRKSIEGL